MEMLKELGRRIQKARKVKKLTQQELADLSHVSLKHVQSCERGERFLQSLEFIFGFSDESRSARR